MSVCFLIQLEFLDPGDVASLFRNSFKHASMKEHCWMKKVSHNVLITMLGLVVLNVVSEFAP
jgi:hypothetical protein